MNYIKKGECGLLIFPNLSPALRGPCKIIIWLFFGDLD